MCICYGSDALAPCTATDTGQYTHRHRVAPPSRMRLNQDELIRPMRMGGEMGLWTGYIGPSDDDNNNVCLSLHTHQRRITQTNAHMQSMDHVYFFCN